MDNIEYPVVTIRWKYLYDKKPKDNIKKYHFQGHYERSKCWFDLDNEWLEEMFCTSEQYFYTKLYKINIEGQEMETYQMIVVLQAYVP